MSDRTENQPEPWKAGHLVADRYEVLEHLGTGGMGVVYRVRDAKSGRIRALKTIRQDLDDATKGLVAKLLKSEADALNRLESDFVVRIFDASLDREQPFVIMEFLPGRDLQRVLDTQGALPLTTTVGLLWQAACALKAIHEQGVVHRDLKPANLYLKTRDDGSLELKVLDFSISRLLDRAGERKTTIVVGTRGFMAPEQAAGYDVDHRADIYSLGQVAHALLRGSLKPGEEASKSHDGAAQLSGFTEWHRRATAYHRDQRFSSAPEAIEALAQVLGVVLPSQEAIKNDGHDSLTAAATILAPSRRSRALGAWAISLGVALATVVVLLLATSSAPRPQPLAREAAAADSKRVASTDVRGVVSSFANVLPAGVDPRVVADTLANNDNAVPLASVSVRHQTLLAPKPPALPRRSPQAQRPSDTF